MGGEIRRFEDAEAVARAVAESFVALAREAVETAGRFTVALTGGDSPRAAYRLLGEPAYAARVPWEAVHVLWGDERCVPPGHPRSNFGLAHRAFLSRVPLPPANVHRMPGERPPAEGARAYAETLRRLFGEGTPRLDLVHLGVGGDGHTASLFPFDGPSLRDRDGAVRVALHRPLGEWRLTLTYPVLNAARRVQVILPGASKAAVARAAIAGPLDPFRLPIQGVRPAGALEWLLDRGAAASLPPAPR